MERYNSQEIVTHFSDRSKVYDESGTWVNNNIILSSIVDCLPMSSNEILNIVDLGAGTGAVAKYIFKQYPYRKTVTAVDICPEMLSKIIEPEIKKYVASLEALPFENNTFDIALSRQCLHYIKDIGRAINEIKRIIKKDGELILLQIVPIESETKDYWSQITQFRQPLRKHYFSENDWLNIFIREGFNPVLIKRFSHQGSILKWAKKYNISDKNLINKYKKMLINAPKQFIEEYHVLPNKDDVKYDSFWILAKFNLSK